jgi:hypothetical protein
MAGGTTQMHIHASLEGMSRIQKLARRRELFGGDELLDLTIEVASQTKLWLPLVRHTSERRWYEALVLSDALELWLIGWAPGQATPTHDHGGAKGALTVAAGDLLETVHADPTLSRPRHIARAQGSGAISRRITFTVSRTKARSTRPAFTPTPLPDSRCVSMTAIARLSSSLRAQARGSYDGR